MYETWTKMFIDILDELAPVTKVLSRLELPLGSVSGEMVTTIHSVLDMLDEDSPWCDLEVHRTENDRLHVHYLVQVPNLNKVADKELLANISSVGSNVTSTMLLSPVGEVGRETYVIKGLIEAPLEHPTDNPNSATHDMAETLVRLMQCGGYSKGENDDAEADSLVAWNAE